MKKFFPVLCFLSAPLAAQAEDAKYSLMPYLWLPTISSESSNASDGTNFSSGLDVGPTDYLKALDFGFMITGDMRKNDYIVKGDLIYLDFSVDDKEVDFKSATGKWDFGLKGGVYTLSGGKTLIKNDRYLMDLLVGWRRLDLEAKLKRTPSLGGGLKTNLKHNDFFLAVNGEYDFEDSNWSLNYYGDIGGGDSDLTWQALVGFDYAFSWGNLHFNYRHLDYDLGDKGKARSGEVRYEDLSMTFSGPSIGARFEF